MHSHFLKKFIKETLYFSGCRVCLNKWNNESVVTKIAPTKQLYLPPSGFILHKCKKKFCPHKILANFKITCIYFFNFWYHSQMLFTCSKQWKHEFLKYVKYAWRTNVQNLLKANNKSTRTRWLMLFWCLHHQLQRCGYSGPIWTSTMELYLEFNRQKLKFSPGF